MTSANAIIVSIFSFVDFCFDKFDKILPFPKSFRLRAKALLKKHTNLYKPSYERKDILIQKFALSIFFENFYERFFDFEKRKTGISIAFYQFFVIIAQYFLSEKFSNDCTNAFCTVTDGLYSYWWASNNAILLPLGTQKSRKIYRACGRY